MKRSRAPNFTNAEIMHLLELVEKYPIIENKKTDGVTTKEKQEAWKLLADEYNSTTCAYPRSMENLLACYKNQKVKVKKQYSTEKMSIKAPLINAAIPGPSSASNNVHIILDAVEEHGQDWDQISKETNLNSQDCKTVFQHLVKKAKKDDADFVKELKRTGGGPPPQPPNDEVLEKVKTLIGPSLEGLFTIYDGDYEFMQQQQNLIPFEKRLQPIEHLTPTCPDKEESIIITPNETSAASFLSSPLSSKQEIGTPGPKIVPKRLNLLKKRIDPSLDIYTTNKGKKKNISESFLQLADDKKELIKVKKMMADRQLLHQEQINAINLQIAKDKLEFERKKNEMEINYLKEKYALELSLLRNKVATE